MGERFSFFKKKVGEAGRAVSERADQLEKRVDAELDEPMVMPRRTLLKGAGAALATGMLIGEELAHTGKEKKESSEKICEEGEMFERQVKTYETVYGMMTANQILFIDDYGAPLGGPYDVEPFEGIDPGKKNEDGIMAGKISQEWLNAVRKDVCRRHPEAKYDPSHEKPEQKNAIQVIREANALEPDLKAKTLLEVVRHNGDKMVVGTDEDLTRIEYIERHIGEKIDIFPHDALRRQKEHFDLPPGVITELRKLMAGLAAQESQYNNDSLSTVGAGGILQFMPGTWNSIWKRFGLETPEKKYLKNQVDATSLSALDNYHYFKGTLSKELAHIKNAFFGGNEADYEKYFLAQIILNAHNTGGPIMSRVVRWFASEYPTKESLEKQIGLYPDGFGYDVYAAMAHEAYRQHPVASYGSDSSTYVRQSHAWANLLSKQS